MASIGGYGMKPFNEYTFSTSATSFTIDINNQTSPKSTLICVSGTLACSSDNSLPFFQLLSTAGYTPQSVYLLMSPYTTSVTRSSGGGSSSQRITRFYQGNSSSAVSVTGERLRVLIWITDDHSYSRPYKSTSIYCQCCTDYTSTYYHVLPTYTVTRALVADRQQRLAFYPGTGSFAGAKLQVWHWVGDV